MIVLTNEGNLQPGIFSIDLSKFSTSIFVLGTKQMSREVITKRKQLWLHAEKYLALLLESEDVSAVYLGGTFCSIHPCKDLDAFFEVNLPSYIGRNRAKALYYVDKVYQRLDEVSIQNGWEPFSSDKVWENGLDIYPSYFAEVPGKRRGIVVETFRGYFSEDRLGRPRGMIQIQKG